MGFHWINGGDILNDPLRYRTEIGITFDLSSYSDNTR